MQNKCTQTYKHIGLNNAVVVVTIVFTGGGVGFDEEYTYVHVIYVQQWFQVIGTINFIRKYMLMELSMFQEHV